LQDPCRLTSDVIRWTSVPAYIESTDIELAGTLGLRLSASVHVNY
jgi:hypothetical protein